MDNENEKPPVDDEFAAAFEDLTVKGDASDPAPAAPAEPVAEPPAAELSADPAADPGAAAAAPEAVEAPADAAPSGDAAAVPAPDAGAQPAAPVDGDAILDRLSRLVAERQPEPAPAAAPEPAPEAPPIYTSEEQAFLTEYDKDWSDVAKGEALKRRAEYQMLLQHVFSQVGQFLSPHLEKLEAVATNVHLGELKTRISDYDQVVDPVRSWVDQQPAYLQAAYNHVIQHGTADEVQDLVDRYRRETGVTPAAAPPAKKAPEPSEAAKQAAASLAPVKSQRTVVMQQDDSSDFDAAFDRFSKAARG